MYVCLVFSFYILFFLLFFFLSFSLASQTPRGKQNTRAEIITVNALHFLKRLYDHGGKIQNRNYAVPRLVLEYLCWIFHFSHFIVSSFVTFYGSRLIAGLLVQKPPNKPPLAYLLDVKELRGTQLKEGRRLESFSKYIWRLEVRVRFCSVSLMYIRIVFLISVVWFWICTAVRERWTSEFLTVVL